MKQKKRERRKKTFFHRLSKDQEALVSSLLGRVEKTPPQELVTAIHDPSCAKAFVDRLPLRDERAVLFLQTINDTFDDKDVKKSVKRALFRLKSKGIRTGDFSSGEAAERVYKPIKKEEPCCYLGPIDAMGNRAVIIHFFESGKGVDVGMGMASDQEGIQQFVFDQMSRKNARELKAELEGMAGPFIKVPLSHGAMVLENAFKLENATHTDERAEYLKLRPWLLQNTSVKDHSVNFDHITPSGREITKTALEKLFEHELMVSWLAPFDVLKPFMMEMENVYQSPIIMSDQQKLHRIEEIKKKCIRSLFDAAGRKRFKKRLLEMAFFFLTSDERDYAQLSLEAAANIQEKTSQFGGQPVLGFFVDRSIAFYFELGNERATEETEMEDLEIPETPSGIILP
ncbi:conserved hypothetical protein [delta proteobacterium NaphS2]|nr:conserved hypothetical protein [delta proteobacterium NaphS2]